MAKRIYELTESQRCTITNGLRVAAGKFKQGNAGDPEKRRLRLRRWYPDLWRCNPTGRSWTPNRDRASSCSV